MSYSNTCDMIAQAGRAPALLWHLTANHYPSIGAEFVPFAEEAIRLARDDEWDTVVNVDGRILEDARTHVKPTARALVENWHLEAFLDAEEGS